MTEPANLPAPLDASTTSRQSSPATTCHRSRRSLASTIPTPWSCWAAPKVSTTSSTPSKSGRGYARTAPIATSPKLKLGDDNLGISTVYLYGNHNWLGGPPLMWETMVNDLGKSSNSWSDFQTRYCNRRAAVNGHLVLANILMSVGMTVTTTNIAITAPEVALPASLRPRAIGDS